MKLSCVTATNNVIKAGNRDSLIRCVKSVAALKTEHEHLIYDGASTDGTAELLRELEATTPELKVASEPDTGIYNALNKGVRDAKGEWFYVLGADDYICNPAVLDKLIGELSDEDDALISAVRQQTVDREKIWYTQDMKLDGLFTWPCVCHQGELIRTEIARELGGFDERYRIAADSDMFFKAHMKNLRFKYTFDIFAYFAFGGVAMSNLDKASREHRTSVANVLGLKGRSRWLMIERHLLPLLPCLKLAYHKDVIIRSSAREMLKANFKHLLRIPLYPLVVLTRPLRHRAKK